MLHRSFKPAKCKTSLKLASSRIKLLKNKRDAQVKQLRRELAQLLEAGQDQTARIRVEHVVREEKTMAAYDLLEIYCELIVARLPIIESQKNCPIDLKEAISSVIFASPRCADVPELMDIRKHFTAKYGKEFVAAAVELRPDCGVSRMMIEKLSAKAPDGPTKIKILSAIADEHNIKWEPTSFGEKDPKIPEDLLNGPNTFEKSSQMLVDPPNVQAPPNFYDKGPPSVQVPPKHNEMHDVPVNLHEHNARSSPHSQSFAATDVGVNKAMSSSASHSEVRPSGSETKGTEFGHSYSGGGNASSFGRQNWNMEFKDATAAAQAAAESAERASMAARAAAELSSRGNITRQYSTESQKSSAYGLRDNQSQKYSGSTLQSDQLSKVPIDSTLHGRNSRMQYEHFNDNEEENPARVAEKFHREGLNSTGTSSQSASLKSTTGFVDDNNASVNNFQMADRYSRKNSSDLGQSNSIGEVSKKKQSSESDVEFLNEVHDGRNSENVDYFEDVRIRKQSSRASSRSHSSTFGDDHDVVSDVFHEENENPFFVDDRRSVQRNTQETSAHEIASAVFDDSGSDDDVEGFGFSSPGRKSPFAVTDSWSLGQITDDSQKKSFSQSHYSTVFSKNPTSSEVLSKLDDPLPVTFDDSDGPSSDIEEERNKSKLVGSTDHGSTVFSKNLPVTFDDSYGPSSDIEEERDESKLVGSTNHGTFPREQNVHSRNSEQAQGESHAFIESSSPEKGNLRSSKPLLRPSSVDSNDVDVRYDGSQTIEFGANSERKFGYGDVTTSQSSPGFRKSQNNYHDSFNNPLDKGSNQQSQQSRFSMVHEVKDDDHMPQLADTMKDTELLTESSLESGKELNFGTLTGGLRNKGFRLPPYTKSSSGNASAPKQAAEDTSYKVEQSSPTVWVSSSTGADSQEPYNQKVSAEANKKTSTRAPVKYFDDSGDEIPQRTFSSSEEPYNKKVVNEENKRSSSTTPVTYFGSESCDSEEDFPKETSTGNARSNAVFSRRTKASALNSKRSSNSNTTVLSETPVTPYYGVERKTSSRSSYATTETQRKPVSQSNSSDPWEGYVQPRLTASKPVSESKRSSREESSKASEREQAVLESKRSSGEERKSSASNSLPKIVTSGSTETSNTSSSSGETLSGGKASHVHPKLPDFDSLTAHFQSLRQNRQ